MSSCVLCLVDNEASYVSSGSLAAPCLCVGDLRYGGTSAVLDASLSLVPVVVVWIG